MSLMQVCGEMNSNVKVEEKLNKTLPIYHHSSDLVETQFSILDYCSSFVPESCLPGVTLIPCFKAILIVALSGYMIRLPS